MSEADPDIPANGAAGDFEHLFDHAPCGYVILGADERISRANTTLATWIGVEPRALTGKRLPDLLTLPGRIFYETNFAPALRLQEALEEVALDLAVGTGDKLPVLISARIRRTPGGALLDMRMILVRASERRSYERDLQGREAAAVRRLNDEKSTSELREQFIAVLGHDLRNPLASIVGATRLLRREVTSEKSLQVLKLMETSVDRMAGLIDDVMDFARGRLGAGIVIERKIQPLDVVLQQVASELEVDQPSRTVLCEFAIHEPVSFDDGRIAQLVSNLLGNALTHGDPRSPVRLAASTAAHELTVSVSNTGKRIEPEAMERLFHPFFRGAVRDSRQGLGLGLHIASEIARAHGGTLTAQSDDAETRFTLKMPCTRPGF